jgi:hypothetical protein
MYIKVQKMSLYYTNVFINSIFIRCRTKRCRDLWWNGLPSSVRGKVWCLAIGNDLLINEELYRSCVSNSFNKFKDSEATMHCLECIHLDITRTFPHLGIFQQVNNYLF